MQLQIVQPTPAFRCNTHPIPCAFRAPGQGLVFDLHPAQPTLNRLRGVLTRITPQIKTAIVWRDSFSLLFGGVTRFAQQAYILLRPAIQTQRRDILRAQRSLLLMPDVVKAIEDKQQQKQPTHKNLRTRDRPWPIRQTPSPEQPWPEARPQ
ncbi:hypothetical protein D3C72_1885300 [compost metagenome]